MREAKVNFTEISTSIKSLFDHIIPVAKGGHPSDLDNLQLAHYDMQ